MSTVHVHLLLNHVPVVGVLIGILLLGYALIRRSSEMSKVSLGVFAALAGVAVGVFLTGEPAEEVVEQLPGFSEAITERHEELARISTIALVAFGVTALAALAHYRRRLLPRWVTAASLALSITIGGLLTATANLGGQIRHTEVRPGAAAAVVGDERDGEERQP